MSLKENTKAKRSGNASSVRTEKNAGMDRTKNHEALLKKCLVMLSSEGFLVWKNNIGVVKTETRYQTYGLKGSPDIIGCTPSGVFFGCEVKTGKAVQNKHQKAFQKAVEKRNGIYIVVRSIEQLKEFISGQLK